MDRFLQSNTVLRVLALLLACTIWLTVNAPNPAGVISPVGITEKFPYPVHVLAPSNMVVTAVSAKTSEIAVSGTALNLATLPEQMSNVEVVANVTKSTAGTYTVPLRVVNMPSVSHTVSPTVLTVTIQPKQTANRSVRIVSRNHPVSGYVVGDLTADTDTAEVIGAASQIAQVTRVEAVVDVAQTRKTYTTAVDLIPVNVKGKPVQGVTVNPARVVVTVPIEAPIATVGLVPEVFGATAPGYAVANVTLTPANVQIYGKPTSALPQGATAPEITVPVGVSGLSHSQTLQVSIPVPAGVNKVMPGNVKATVKIEPSVTRVFNHVPILVKNVPPGESVQMKSAGEAQVSVSGPTDIIAGLSLQDIQLFVDASTLTPASKQAMITALVPNWVHITQISPNLVKVKVSKTS